jgi:hypothetical protein
VKSAVRLAGILALMACCVGVAQARVPSEEARDPACVAKDTTDLTPTLRAPDWYVAGVTPLCSPVKEKGTRLLTAYWIFYDCNQADCWRTTPQNADYSAKDCEQSYTTCGQKIIQDASWFYQTCTGLGLSKYDVARNMRYWADRARANGSNWRVYTLTETGGYPYRCQFSVVAL